MKKIVSILLLALALLLNFSVYAYAESQPFTINLPDIWKETEEATYEATILTSDGEEATAYAYYYFPELYKTEEDAFSFFTISDISQQVMNSMESVEGVTNVLYVQPLAEYQTNEHGYRYLYAPVTYEDEGEACSHEIYLFFGTAFCFVMEFDYPDANYALTQPSLPIIETLVFGEELDMYIKESSSDSYPDGDDLIQEPDDKSAPDKANKEEDPVEKIILTIIPLLCFSLLAFFFGRIIYWHRDHGKWSKGAVPNPYATIASVNSKKIYMGRNDTKFLTTITFSDGFVFKTTKTKREQHLLSYQISIDDETRQIILENALKLHQKAIDKYKPR